MSGRRQPELCFYIIETAWWDPEGSDGSSPSRADELHNQKYFQDTSRDKLDVTRGPEELSPHLM